MTVQPSTEDRAEDAVVEPSDVPTFEAYVAARGAGLWRAAWLLSGFTPGVARCPALAPQRATTFLLRLGDGSVHTATVERSTCNELVVDGTRLGRADESVLALGR